MLYLFLGIILSFAIFCALMCWKPVAAFGFAITEAALAVIVVIAVIIAFILRHLLGFVMLGAIALVIVATIAATLYLRDSFGHKHGFFYYLVSKAEMLRRAEEVYSTLGRICKHCTDSSVQDLAIYTQKGVRSLHIQIRQLTKSDQGTAAVLAKLEKYEKETERLEKLYIDHMLSLVPGIPKQI